MSINVTVKGNPVSIRRGKMVTADPEHARKEFEKRRRMRLEQVRQQSKDIAQDVRDKVRKEKSKQITDVEKEGAAKLKEWQNRKLLQLQNQYEECLMDIGLGHNLATVEEDEEEQSVINNGINKQLARERGEKAAALLQIEKNYKNLKTAVPQQQKKIAREIEKTRSAMVTALQKNKKRSRKRKIKKTTTDSINISIESSSDSDIPMLNLSNNTTDESCEEPIDTVQHHPSSNRSRLIRCPSKCPSPEICSVPLSPRKQEFTYDNRISNRIKQRNLYIPSKEPLIKPLDTANFRNCDIYPHKSLAEVQSSQQSFAATRSEYKSNIKVPHLSGGTSRVNFDCPQQDCSSSKKEEKIPYKPTVSLKDAKSSEKIQHKSSHRVEKVVYYDHPNRYTRTCPPEANVERIPAASIEVCPTNNEFGEYMAKTYKRDKDAETRGQIALEKQKITRDYEDMLRKLPVLQKQERIASIKAHDQNFHLSDDRVKEQEKIKQNRMENHYNKSLNLPVPPIITIPPIAYSVTNPMNASSNSCHCDTTEAPELNLGTWDVVDASVPLQESDLNVEDLQSMLDRLKLQRDKIMREIGVLPKNSKLYKLINELEGIEDDNADGRDKEQKKSKTDSIKKRRQRPKKHSRTDTTKSKQTDRSGSSTPPAKKKSKSKSSVPTSQNICTQTTPRCSSIERLKPQTQDKSTIVDRPIEKKVSENCLCNDNLQKKDSEKLCEIVIKIREDKEPEVIVSPKKDEVIVQTETVVLKNVQSQNSKKITQPSYLWKDSETNQTSSTSYRSLPDFNKNVIQDNRKCSRLCPSLLQNKPKQRNLRECNLTRAEGSRKELDPRLILYIKKLLAMSHYSIDKLGVSTSSEISTPNQSVFNSYVNNPLEQLQNVMKFYNLSPADVSYYVNSKTNKSNSTMSEEGTSCDKSCASDRNPKSTKSRDKLDSAILPGDETISTQYNSIAADKDPRLMSLLDYSATNYPDIMLKYAEIAENCHQRISNLTAMIEKVRQEKQEILKNPNSSNSDKENSTIYLNLPSKFIQEPDSKSSSSSTTITSCGEDLTRKVLDIDYSLAEKLKKLSCDELNKLYNEIKLATNSSSDDGKKTNNNNSNYDEIAQRFNKLIAKEPEDNKKQCNIALNNFVPLLLDIKELPKLPQQNKPSYNIDLIKSTKRPPPSKGYVAVQRVDNNVKMQHQLSTIIEADSQISTKLKDRQSVGSQCSVNNCLAIVESQKQNNGSDKSSGNKSKQSLSSNSSKQSIVITSDSSTEKSDFENMEAMLKSMGMGWAVATLRKTQEALQHSSSTSSLDINISRKEIKVTDSSSSEISLKSFLEKQLIQKLTSSKDSSTVDITHFMREIGEVSVSRSNSDNNKNQRTSTPIQTTRSTEKSKTASVQFPGESDISSVKSNTDQGVNNTDVNFISLMESSRKSKDSADDGTEN